MIKMDSLLKKKRQSVRNNKRIFEKKELSLERKIYSFAKSFDFYKGEEWFFEAKTCFDII